MDGQGTNGAVSGEVACRTEGLPNIPGAPMRLDSSNYTTLVVGWAAPISGGSSVLSYNVEMDLVEATVNTEDWKVVCSVANALSCAVSTTPSFTLVAGAKYRVRVQSMGSSGSKGYSVISELIAENLPELVTLSSVSPLSSNSLKLTWTKPTSSRSSVLPILNYRLYSSF